VTQVQSQIGDVARNDGLAVVFTNVRGAGKAIDITDQVVKAIAALPAAVPSSSSSASEVPSSTTPSPSGS
jgi:hypothetical protein